MIAAEDLQLVQETAQELHERGQEKRARALEAVLAVAVSALAGRAPLSQREYLTTGQAASVLGVSRQTVRNWVATGRLDGVYQGGRALISRDAVLAHLETLKESTPAEPVRTSETAHAQREWREFLLRGLPTDKVARQEALHEKMEDGHPLSQAERAEMANFEREIAAAAAQLLESWLLRPATRPS